MHSALPIFVTAVFLVTGVAKASDVEHEQFPHHHLAIFAGGGIEKEHGHSEKGSALGLEYELRFHEKWGIGGDLEKLFGSGTNRSWVVAMPLSFHPSKNWRIFLGPGYEFHGKQDKYLLRTGIAYEWELKHGWTMSPEIIADFLQGGAKTFVAGISIGHGF